MEGAWQHVHVATGFSVTRDGSQIISVMRDRAQISHEMPQGPRLTTAYWKQNYIGICMGIYCNIVKMVKMYTNSRFIGHCFGFQSQRFSLLVQGYNI